MFLKSKRIKVNDRIYIILFIVLVVMLIIIKNALELD